ncbi:hypothetical protein BDN72DRAFT_262186 [Pluteus cervinus]|uniref:Uncharacterized protein n=1 Tax=Pluteus cervinus TaxID=181527 RepID=A0ACD3AG94_9AGAR|nr:hypothetical protein BDN72DRAFT_262186 [Pluteus cervinus]
MSFVDLTETPSDNDANSDPPPVRRGTGRKSKGKHTKSPITSWDTLVGNSENPISISDSDDEGQAEVAKAKGKGKEVEDIKQDTKAAGPSHSKSPGTSTSVAKATSVDITPSPPSSTAPSPVNEAFADDEEDYGMDVDQPVHSPMDAPSLHDAEAAPLFEPHEKSMSPAPTNDLGTSGEKTSVSGGMVVDRPSPGLSPEHPRVVAMSPPQTPITENVILPASPQHVQDTLHTPLQHGFSSLHRITPSPKLAPSTSFSSTPTSSQRPLPLPIPRSFSGSPTKPSRSESSFASPGAPQMGAPALSFPRSPSTLPHHRRSSDDINMRGLESALDESTQSSPTGMAGPSTGSPNPRSLLSSLPRGLPNSPTNSVRNRPISGLPKPRKDILTRFRYFR